MRSVPRASARQCALDAYPVRLTRLPRSSVLQRPFAGRPDGLPEGDEAEALPSCIEGALGTVCARAPRPGCVFTSPWCADLSHVLSRMVQACFHPSRGSAARTATPMIRPSGATAPSGRRPSATRAGSETTAERRVFQPGRASSAPPFRETTFIPVRCSALGAPAAPPRRLRGAFHSALSCPTNLAWQGRLTAQRNKIAKGVVAQRASAAASAASGAGAALRG